MLDSTGRSADLTMVSPVPRSSARCECPHIDRSDQRCASRFSLGSIDSMFHYCCGGFHGCPVYHRINMELSNADSSTPRVATPRRHQAISVEGIDILPAVG